MANKTTPLADNNTQNEALEQTRSDLENHDSDDSKRDAEEDRQMMFEQIFSKLMDGFGKACEEEGVKIAVAIAMHPLSDRPMVFYKAPHIVDAGTVMAGVLREIKSDVAASLDTAPQ